MKAITQEPPFSYTHRMTNLSQFAQDFPGFSTESPIFWELPGSWWTMLKTYRINLNSS